MIMIITKETTTVIAIRNTKKKIHYTTNVNNSISRAKVSRDSENFYFYVKTVNDIKEGTPGWMNLYTTRTEIMQPAGRAMSIPLM